MVRFLIDMDEVLTDFVGGAAELWGLARGQVQAHWEAGKWDMVPPLSKALGRPSPMSNNEFWDRLKTCPSTGSEPFWTGLRPLPWIEEVVALARRYAEEWRVCTSPSLCPGSYSGKVRWLQNYFGKGFNSIIPTSDKDWLARPGTLLLDDREETVRRFREAGGEAILFPAWHSSLYRFRDDPVRYVESALTDLRIRK